MPCSFTNSKLISEERIAFRAESDANEVRVLERSSSSVAVGVTLGIGGCARVDQTKRTGGCARWAKLKNPVAVHG
jgi:glycerol dehydrogenase-like iron-containing ADH family enzyme